MNNIPATCTSEIISMIVDEDELCLHSYVNQKGKNTPISIKLLFIVKAKIIPPEILNGKMKTMKMIVMSLLRSYLNHVMTISSNSLKMCMVY